MDKNTIKEVDEQEVKEWHLTIRENTLCIEEENIKTMLRNFEENEQNRNTLSLEREREIEQRERTLSKEQKLLEDAQKEFKNEGGGDLISAAREDKFNEEAHAANSKNENAPILKIVINLNVTEKAIKTEMRSNEIIAKEVRLYEKENDMMKREQEIEKKDNHRILKKRLRRRTHSFL